MKNKALNKKNAPELSADTGDRHAAAHVPVIDMSVLTFNSASAEIQNISTIDELSLCKDDAIMWININGLKDSDSLKKLEKIYSIHPLTIEDVLNTKQQPKVETFENYRFISFKSIQREKSFHHIHHGHKRFYNFAVNKKNQPEEPEEFTIDQISLIIMKNTVITFQEIPGESV